MNSSEKRSFVRIVSIVISSALLITAPGLPFYQAAAQMLAPSATGSARPVGNGGARTAVAGSALGHDFVALELPVRNLGLLRGPGIVQAVGNPGWKTGPREVLSSRPSPVKPAVSLRASAGIVSAVSETARRWAVRPDVLSSPREIARMASDSARETGARIMDRISGERRIAATGALSAFFQQPSDALLSGRSAGRGSAGLLQFTTSNGGGDGTAVPSPIANRPSASGPSQAKPSRAKDLLKSLPWMALGGAAVYALQHFSTLWSIFGFVQAAALWGTVSGIPVFGAAVWARHRLSLRDSSRLNGVKRLLSGLMGAYVGAAALIFLKGTGLAAFAGLPWLAWAAPILSGASLWLGKSGFLNNGVGGVLNLGAIYGAFQVSAVAAVAFASSAHPISLGPLVGIMAVAAMMNIALFLGEIIDAAEKGQTFSSRWIEARRFLAYTWVMIGAAFASLSGFSPLWVNYALMLWSFAGTKKAFDVAFLGALGWAAYTGFGAPIAFLVLAFAPERAEMWTRYLLTRFFKKGKGAPSSIGNYQFTPVEKKPAKSKRVHLWLKTGLYFAGFLGYAALAASIVPGWAGSFPKQFLSGLLPVLLSVLAGPWLIEKLFKGQVLEPTTDARAAAVHEVVDRLLKKYQEQHPGEKPLTKAKIVRIMKKVMPVPNAFATGAMPRGKGFFRPLIGITEVFEEMIFIRENLLGSLHRLLDMTEAEMNFSSLESTGAIRRFKLYRAAIREVIPDIPEEATPQQVRAALNWADTLPDRDKTFWALGVNILEGVLSHEINHNTHRDMIVSGSGAAVSSAIVATSKSVFWKWIGVRKLSQTVRSVTREIWTRVKAAWRRVRDWVAGKSSNSFEAAPEAVGLDPFSSGPGLILTWAEPVSTILQMTVSRERESLADRGGSELSEHPERLGLALGLLSSWRPSAAQSIESGQFRNLSALSGIMTVNPIQQLYDAGLLQEFRAAARSLRGAEPEDRIFATWFETHPNIQRRIEALYDLWSGNGPKGYRGPTGGPSGSAQAAPDGNYASGAAAPPADGARSARATHSDPPRIGGQFRTASAGAWGPVGSRFDRLGTGSYSHPASAPRKSSLHPPDTPSEQKTGPPEAETRSGSFQKIWDKVTKPFRVFSDKNRNRPFRQIMVAEGMMILAANFHGVGIRGLVGSDARMATSNGVFQLGQLLSNVFVGPLMERRPNLNKTLGHLYVAMGLSILAIAAGYFWGHPLFGLFAAGWFLFGALRGTAWVGEATLYSKIVQSSRAYTKASAVYSAMINFVGFFAGLAAGWFLGFANERFDRKGLGSPLTFAIAGALMLLAVPLFRTLSVAEDPTEAAVRREFSEKLLPVLGARLGKVYFNWESTSEGPEQVLVAEVRAPKAKDSGPVGVAALDRVAMPEEFAGYRVKVLEPRKPLREIADGARITWKDPFLRLLMLLTVSAFAVGAAMYPAMSVYIGNVLHLEAAGAVIPGFLKNIPFLGGVIHYLATDQGALGLYFAVASLAMGLTSLPFALWGDRANSDFEETLGKFSEALEERGGFSMDSERAVAAVRKAGDQVLLDYVASWRKDPRQSRTLAQFQQDLLEAARARLGALATPEEARRAVEATGLETALGIWAQKHHRGVLATARRDARSGMSSKARQARWSAVSYALGALCYLGVFGSSGIWSSLSWLLVASILQSPAWIVLFEGSLNNEIIAEKYSDYRTRLYAFVGVYALAAGVAGAFGFGLLVKFLGPASLSTIIGFQALLAALFIWTAFSRIPAIGRDLLSHALKHRNE